MDKVERIVERVKADEKRDQALERRAKAADAARTDQPPDTAQPDPRQ